MAKRIVLFLLALAIASGSTFVSGEANNKPPRTRDTTTKISVPVVSPHQWGMVVTSDYAPREYVERQCVPYSYVDAQEAIERELRHSQNYRAQDGGNLS